LYGPPALGTLPQAVQKAKDRELDEFLKDIQKKQQEILKDRDRVMEDMKKSDEEFKKRMTEIEAKYQADMAKIAETKRERIADERREEIDAYVSAWYLAQDMNDELHHRLAKFDELFGREVLHPHFWRERKVFKDDYKYCWWKHVERSSERSKELNEDIRKALDLAAKAYNEPTEANLKAVKDANSLIAQKLLLIDTSVRLVAAADFLYRGVWNVLPQKFRDIYPTLLKTLSKEAEAVDALLSNCGNGLSDKDVFKGIANANKAIGKIGETLEGLKWMGEVVAKYNKAMLVVSLVFGFAGAIRIAAGRVAAGEVALIALPRLTLGEALAVESVVVVSVNIEGASAGALLVYMAAQGGVGPNQVGELGQSAVPGKQNTSNEFTGASGRTRRPDRYTKSEVGEIKNVKYQYFSTQLKDYLAFARKTKRKFVLWVRGDLHKSGATTLSEELKTAVRQGQIELKAIPGTGKLPSLK
jgi:hypothetical protein